MQYSRVASRLNANIARVNICAIDNQVIPSNIDFMEVRSTQYPPLSCWSHGEENKASVSLRLGNTVGETIVWTLLGSTQILSNHSGSQEPHTGLLLA